MIGLALAGGGPLAAVYEIGVLAALEESIEGLDLNDAGIYVGISAGGIVAAALANGITPHQMVRLFIESDVASQDGPALFKPEILLRPAGAELRKHADIGPKLARHGLRLKLGVLRDTSLHLVPEAPSRKALARLGRTLDDLERYLKVVHS